MFELSRLKNLCINEIENLKEQTKEKVQKILQKEKNLID